MRITQKSPGGNINLETLTANENKMVKDRNANDDEVILTLLPVMSIIRC